MFLHKNVPNIDLKRTITGQGGIPCESVDQVAVIITSVNYADLLKYSLPRLSGSEYRVFVITSAIDYETQETVRAHGVGLLISDSWQKEGATFNKSSAINECLQYLQNEGWGSWVLLLDADIVLPYNFFNTVMELDCNSLYSVRRRICATRDIWLAVERGEVPVSSLPLEDLPQVVDGKVWGHRPTCNPAALMGYFQLWHIMGASGMKRMPLSNNAAGYDVEFALSFPENKRHYLPDLDVVHLGETRINWDGRITEQW